MAATPQLDTEQDYSRDRKSYLIEDERFTQLHPLAYWYAPIYIVACNILSVQYSVARGYYRKYTSTQDNY